MNSNLGILQKDALNLLQTLLKQKQLNLISWIMDAGSKSVTARRGKKPNLEFISIYAQSLSQTQKITSYLSFDALKKELLFKAQGSFVVNFHELLEGVWDNVLGQVREILFV